MEPHSTTVIPIRIWILAVAFYVAILYHTADEHKMPQKIGVELNGFNV